MSANNVVTVNLKKGGVTQVSIPMEYTPESLAASTFAAEAYGSLLRDDLDELAVVFPELVNQVREAQAAIRVLISDVSMNNEMAKYSLLATLAVGVGTIISLFVLKGSIDDLKEEVKSTRDMTDALVFLQMKGRAPEGVTSDRERRIDLALNSLDDLARERNSLTR